MSTLTLTGTRTGSNPNVAILSKLRQSRTTGQPGYGDIKKIEWVGLDPDGNIVEHEPLDGDSGSGDACCWFDILFKSDGTIQRGNGFGMGITSRLTDTFDSNVVQAFNAAA